MSSSCCPCIQLNSPRVHDGLLEEPITEGKGLLALYDYEQKFKCLFQSNAVKFLCVHCCVALLWTLGSRANNLASQLSCAALRSGREQKYPGTTKAEGWLLVPGLGVIRGWFLASGPSTTIWISRNRHASSAQNHTSCQFPVPN